MRRFAELFFSFFKIGLFTFGGGYAMIPIIQREVIDNRHWIEQQEFLDLLTLAQSAPGPISLNTAVFVGYKMYGYRGALSALLGVILPSFLIILVVAIFFSQIRENAIVDAAFKGMRPAVVALIVAPILSLSQTVHRLLWIVIVATALSIHWLGWSPVILLLAGALLGIAYEVWNAKRLNR